MFSVHNCRNITSHLALYCSFTSNIYTSVSKFHCSQLTSQKIRISCVSRAPRVVCPGAAAQRTRWALGMRMISIPDGPIIFRPKERGGGGVRGSTDLAPRSARVADFGDKISKRRLVFNQILLLFFHCPLSQDVLGIRCWLY